MTEAVGLCEFTFRGGPLDGQRTVLGSQPCECCGEMKHPDTMPYGQNKEGLYRREKGSTVFRWMAGYQIVP